jgi:Trk K+ transport system NAD-binding subunit
LELVDTVSKPCGLPWEAFYDRLPETIGKVPMERADVFAALTGDTNANVAACYIARTGVDSIKTVMRIGSDDEREYSGHDAIDAVVFPEAVGAETATKQILQS